MTDNIDAGNNDEFCQIAYEEAQELCGSVEQAFVQACRFMGFGPDEIDELIPLDEKSRLILEDGITGQFDQTRRWIVARAWVACSDDGVSLFEAFQIAWQEALNELAP